MPMKLHLAEALLTERITRYKMKLSVIIVNYNVRHFLEQCLISVENAIERMSAENQAYRAEIIVVDNNSIDGSVRMIKERFPGVILIANKENTGFSKANNQGIKIAKGAYILLLNPDTVVEEDTFLKTIEYMQAHEDVGGLGAKMIDGAGKFLPESKRGLPTPWTAFYKISGISMLFNKSKRFAKYHLGYLDENKIWEVDVLSGAFMLIRRKVLDKAGWLDETFFMYGEDIDLSYRIQLAGYKNVYFPKTKIIHYKGESTKRGSMNYVFLFYKAMIIFAQKHFSKQNASVYRFFINLAIYTRAALSVIYRIFSTLALPFFDFVLLFSGLLLAKWFWESNSAFGHGFSYPKEMVLYVFPLYTVLWMAGLLSMKAYKKPFSTSRIIKGVLLGTVLVSSVYAFFEESMRYSRAMILLGMATSFIAAFVARILINTFDKKRFSLNFGRPLKIAIVGYEQEALRVKELLSNAKLNFELSGFISPDVQSEKNVFLGSIHQINDLIRFYKINELIFCSGDISNSQIIEIMSGLANRDVIYKIAPAESLYIIGSKAKNQSGDFYTIDVSLEISKRENKIYKRVFDIGSSVLLFALSPLMILVQKELRYYFKNIISVLLGRKSWVGYCNVDTSYALPEIKPGVFCVCDLYKKSVDPDKQKELNLHYARSYHVNIDFELLWKNLRKIGTLSPNRL